MNFKKRIFIIGHPGTGKALFARELSKKLGWNSIDVDFGLEIKIGKTMHEILGEEGGKRFHLCEAEILRKLVGSENSIINTDASILCSEENKKMLSSEFLVYLTVKKDVQKERRIRNSSPLLNDDLDTFLKQLHLERDKLYEQLASITIDTSDGNIEMQISQVIKKLDLKNALKTDNVTQDILIIFHKVSHKPVHLNQKQSECLKLLASGKTAKEIAAQMNLSNRTIEDYIEQLNQLLGCASSKELISLYFD